MYLKKLNIQNYGCITDLSYEPKYNATGYPKPIVLMGKNGSGKTLALTNVVDSLLELKRSKSPEDSAGLANYRMWKKDYIQSGQNFSFVEIEFEEDKKVTTSIDLAVNDRQQFLTKEDITKFKDFDKFDAQFVKNGYYKRTIDNTPNDVFGKNIFLYFPVHRYYQPSWASKEASKVEISLYDDEDVIRYDADMVKVNVLKEIEQWILDLILDRYLYEAKMRTKTVTDVDKDGNPVKRDIVEHLGYQGKNNTTINLLNNLLTIIYRRKYKNFEYARLGISKKEKRKVSIIVKQKDKPEIQLAPTFSHLSSGEAMLISLFGSILKQYDLLNETGAKSLEEIKGIVLIDEVDLNLNLEYAKEIVPELISAFRGVQFIVSTHSPFFMLGMREHFNDDCEFVYMPDGIKFYTQKTFDDIKAAYSSFIADCHSIDK